MIPLFQHQKASIKFFSTRPHGFDASDPGTGKTRVQIELKKKRANKKKMLVLAPKSLLHTAWEADFKKFAPNLIVVVITASTRENFTKPADVYITNTDAVNWLAKQPKKFFRDFEDLTVDESTAYKHHTSGRSKALKKIASHFKYRYLMSGTPRANSVTDLWHQMLIVDGGQRLGRSFTHFRNSVQAPTQVGHAANMIKWEDRPGAELAVGQLIRDITIRHRFTDCLDIPENFSTTRTIELSPTVEAAYTEMKKVAFTELQNGARISAVNAASVLTKLRQIASGAVYDGPNIEPIDTERYELIAELVSHRPHTIVFFQWTHQKLGLETAFKAQDLSFTVLDGTTNDAERKTRVVAFQAGFYRAILLHPQSGAHGLTLTKATTTIWASPTYNLEHYLQGNKRAYRAGQSMKTETINIIAANTIEEAIVKKLEEKNIKQLTLLDLLQSEKP